MKRVVAGEDEGGVTEEVEWEGGGGFRILDVAQSMFEESDGVVLLSDWATGGELGETTAAQLGYEFESSAAPFCGSKGRSRLAVVDGRVNRAVAELLVGLLEPEESLLICGTSVSADVLDAPIARCSMRKIPSSILTEYQRAYRSKRRNELGLEAQAVSREEVGASA